MQSGQLRLTLEAPARARLGRPVPLVFQVSNTGRKTVTLQLLGREPTADFRVLDGRGRMVWSLRRGQTMLGALRLYPLEGGKSLRFRAVWDQRGDDGKAVRVGEYGAQGVLLTDAPGGLASPSARIRIE